MYIAEGGLIALVNFTIIVLVVIVAVVLPGGRHR
jgi:hypothetical protein